MKQAAANPTTKHSSGDSNLPVGAIALTFLDTTWRIATPVILCTLLGIWVDLHYGTKPWVTLTAVLIGFGLAVLLVKKQIEAVQKMEGKKS